MICKNSFIHLCPKCCQNTLERILLGKSTKRPIELLKCSNCGFRKRNVWFPVPNNKGNIQCLNDTYLNLLGK